MPYSYRTLVRTLHESGVDEPTFEAEILLEHFASLTSAAIFSDRDRMYDNPALDEAVERRKRHIPLQYILGSWDFFGCNFRVDEHCLIPRPDTEVLVEEAIRCLPQGARFADLCTGSGCIAVATLASRPDTTATALELYPDTLALALENARRNGVSDRFFPIRADLLSPTDREALAAHAPFDAILSNPPYIRTSDLDALSPEVHHEPLAALDGGEDGLLFYRTILGKCAAMVKSGGYILLEIGFDQADDLRFLCADILPEATLMVKQDLGGRDRVAIVRLPA